MVVTPPTTSASADFCLPRKVDRSPRIRYDSLPLSLAASTWSRSDPLGASLSLASLPGAPRLPTQFLFIESRFCAPASSPRSLTRTQLPSASGSSDQRPQRTFTPKLSPMPSVPDRVGGGLTAPVLPHHRTCGSASGGSVGYDEVASLRVEPCLIPVDPAAASAPHAYLTSSALLPRPVCS